MASTNLFISGLPAHCNDTMLRQVFEPFGPVSSVKVLAGKGIGFVQYAHAGAAASAIAQMNGSALDGSTLAVKHADRNPGDRKQAMAGFGGFPAAGVAAPPTPSDNVFVGGLPFEWTEADLNTLMGSCGEIVSSVVLVNKTTGRSKGAGLVRFSDVGAAQFAVQSLNGFTIDGTNKVLEVRFSDSPEVKGAKKAVKMMMGPMRYSPYGMPGAVGGFGAGSMLGGIRGPAVGPMSPQMFGGGAARIVVPKRADVQPEEGANVHIFGLDPNVTNLHLYEAFAGYGAVRSVRVMTDPVTKASKGFGFVQFFNAQDAHSAIAALNGLQVGNRPWSVTIHKKKA